MKIELTCRDNDNYEREVEVYALCFEPQSKIFSMSYCMGDSWGLVMKCPFATSPISFEFQGGQVTIRFERQEEADAFGAWLIEGEKTVQDGFRTMRG
jgi:hypothetical protein